jgi:hypothetical protein
MGPERTLLDAVGVLHDRGATAIRVRPYHYATGHWRCTLLIAGEPVQQSLRYTNGRGWLLPGRRDATPISPEEEADALWAALDEQQRALARQADPEYVAWYADLLDRCQGGMLPTLWDDFENFEAQGFVRLAGPVDRVFVSEDFPLPPA